MNFILPFAGLSVNQLFLVGHRRMYCSPKYREFKALVHLTLCEILPTDFVKLDGKIKINIIFSFTDKRKRDIDNLLKALFDSFNNIVWTDDSQVFECNTVKILNADKNYISIDITVVTS